MIVSQFGGDWLTNTIWLILFFLMMFFYPRLMVTTMIMRLESTVNMLAGLTNSAKKSLLRKLSKKPTKKVREAINNFLEFFTIQPVSLDPFGIVKKIEHLSNLQNRKFKYFVKNIAPNLDSESRANLMMGLAGAISLHQMEKIVRHYVEMIKKTRNLQLAIILQMQLPLIERLSRALFRGVRAITNGYPLGDSIGALVAANLIDGKTKEIEEDTLLAVRKIKGRTAYIIKAKGPGSRLGKLGRAVEKIVKREKVDKIITIDAAVKLEGEKTGTVAEGVGVAIGGLGVDRAYIEEISTKKKIPLDSIVIKMSQEEAVMPMKLEILNSLDRVTKLVYDNVASTEGKNKIIIVGVGNTCGIGNSRKTVEKTRRLIRRNALQLKKELEEERKRLKKKSIFSWFNPYGI